MSAHSIAENPLLTHLSEQLSALSHAGNLRKLRLPSTTIDFASNDYLGFARNSALFESVSGSTGSRLLTGNSQLATHLETTIADYHRAEAGLIFNTGYMANVGLLSSLMNACDICLFDRDIHASMHDGMHLSQAKSISWQHNNPDDLEKKLTTANTDGNIFVVIESVYSCDGSITPLAEISRLCRKYHAYLIVDEAHATGVIGDGGIGLVASLNEQDNVLARVVTFSKAIGCFGAIVLSSPIVREYLINHCRPLIYATMLPPAVLLTIESAYKYLPQADQKRKDLKHVIEYFKKSIGKSNLSFLPSDTPIQSLLIPGCGNARRMALHLQGCGFDVRALTAPTVKRGQERLRICLHAHNTIHEIESLMNEIESAMQELIKCE